MREREEAISLIEVIIATFLLVFLMSVVYYIFYRETSAWEKGNIRLQLYQNGRSCLDIMRREIESAFISPSNPSLIFKGRKKTLEYVSISNNVKKAGQYDLCRVKYYLKGTDLLREVKTFMDSQRHGGTGVIAFGVLDLNFSYYDGNRWREEWDSTAGTPENISDDHLPLAVKIAITLQDKEGKEKPFVLSAITNLSVRGGIDR